MCTAYVFSCQTVNSLRESICSHLNLKQGVWLVLTELNLKEIQTNIRSGFNVWMLWFLFLTEGFYLTGTHTERAQDANQFIFTNHSLCLVVL